MNCTICNGYVCKTFYVTQLNDVMVMVFGCVKIGGHFVYFDLDMSRRAI